MNPGFDKNDYRMIYNFFKISLKDKYLASSLGAVWAILNPVIMLSIFTFIFGFVYRARLPGADTTLAYVIWLISGYGPWLAMNEGILNASTAVASNAGIVKNMAFKTEILPISAILVSIIPLMVSLGFLAIVMLSDGNAPDWHIILLVPVIAIMYLFMFGLGFFLSALTVFLRDIIMVLPNILMIILFMSPIFYTLESMPKPIQWLATINPFYILSQGFRLPLVYHTITPALLYGLLYVFLLSIILCYFGLSRFRQVKGYFTSVL